MSNEKHSLLLVFLLVVLVPYNVHIDFRVQSCLVLKRLALNQPKCKQYQGQDQP